jgi:hypothetical protein
MTLLCEERDGLWYVEFGDRSWWYTSSLMASLKVMALTGNLN